PARVEPVLDLSRCRFRSRAFGGRRGGTAALQLPDRRRREEDPLRHAHDPRGRARDPPRPLRRPARGAPAAGPRRLVRRGDGVAPRGDGAGVGAPRRVPSLRAAGARALLGDRLDPFRRGGAVTLEVRSPLAGFAMALADVPDEVFAQTMAGDGVAIDPT